MSTNGYQAKVKNTSEFMFLSGSASIFMNNNFVAKSSIPVRFPTGTISLYLRKFAACQPARVILRLTRSGSFCSRDI